MAFFQALPDVAPIVWVPPSPPVKEISVDIGSRNFAIRVEVTESPRPHPLAILFDLVDFGEDKANIDAQCDRMSRYFTERRHIFDGAKVLVVEQQRLIHNQIQNATRNMRMMQHVFSYFQLFHPTIERVELSPLIKTGAGSGAPKGMDRDERKDWGIAKAIELLTERGDTASLNVIAGAKKKDDLTDTVIQLWMYRQWRQKRENSGLDTTMQYQPTIKKRRPRTQKSSA
jgi:hypothetical protein